MHFLQARRDPGRTGARVALAVELLERHDGRAVAGPEAVTTRDGGMP